MASTSPPLSDEMIELVAHRFRLLGEPARLRMLQLLELREHTVNELAEAMSGTQPNISRHLTALHQGGILHRRRDGNNVYYSISDPMVLKLCEMVCGSAREHIRQRLAALESK